MLCVDCYLKVSNIFVHYASGGLFRPISADTSPEYCSSSDDSIVTICESYILKFHIWEPDRK